MTAIPYVAISADELGEPTEVIHCTRCGEQHSIEYGTSQALMPDGKSWSKPKPSRLVGFYECRGELYLGTIDGKRWK